MLLQFTRQRVFLVPDLPATRDHFNGGTGQDHEAAKAHEPFSPRWEQGGGPSQAQSDEQASAWEPEEMAASQLRGSENVNRNCLNPYRHGEDAEESSQEI